MGPLVEVHDNALGLDLHHAPGLDEPTVQLFGVALVETRQWSGQPALTAVGDDGQGNVHVHVEAHLARPAVEVEEVDTDA